MSPTERREKALEKAAKESLTLDEEARITEGVYIRREKPIGERSHLQTMLKHLQEQESREEARREWEARKKASEFSKKYYPEDEECPHDEHDHGICLDCGKDIMDDLIERAELLKDE